MGFMLAVLHARWCVLGLAAALFGMWVHAPAHAEAQATVSTSQYGIHKPLGEAYAAAPSVAKEQTRLVVYRAPTDGVNSVDAAGVVSVHINDRYHASLQKGAFSVICLGIPQAEVRTRFVPKLTTDPHPQRDALHAVALAGGQSVFLRVAHTADQQSHIELVSAQTAGEDLVHAKQQRHTLSRVFGAQACREASDTRMALEPQGMTQGAGAVLELSKGEVSAPVQ